MRDARMTTLIAGCAALYDLLLAGDGLPRPGSIGALSGGPGLDGVWLPGGAAPTVALAMAAMGAPGRLWHPLPGAALDGTRGRLAAGGVEVDSSPVDDGPARCVLIRLGSDAIGWSASPAQLDERLDQAMLGNVFDGVHHLVVCPRWGAWTEEFLAGAFARGIACSVVGMLPPPGTPHRWRVAVLSERQLTASAVTGLDADILIITRGQAGSRIRIRTDWLEIPPAAVGEVVDPTGAGDVYAGTFLAALELGLPIGQAAEAAADASARCCEAWGAQTALRAPARQAVADRGDRARGALWGLACGDALGMPSSFIPAGLLHSLWPLGLTELTDAPSESPYHTGYPAGRVTDDTQQALALTKALVVSPEYLDAQEVARQLDAWLSSVGGPDSAAVGPSTGQGLAAWRSGVPIAESGRTGVTNGAAMRITPVGVVHGLRDSGASALLDDVVAACLVTHNTAPAISGAAAVAGAVAAGVAGRPWREVIGAGIEYARRGRDRAPWVYGADVADRIEFAVELALGATTDADCSRLMSQLVGTGESSTEAIPAAFAIAARANGEPQRAMILAANTEGDADTIAAMAGAISGAWAGEAAIPKSWRVEVAAVNELDVVAWAEQLNMVATARGGVEV